MFLIFIQKSDFLKQPRSPDPAKFIRENLKLLFDDTLAVNLSWRGTTNKDGVRALSVIAALRSKTLLN